MRLIDADAIEMTMPVEEVGSVLEIMICNAPTIKTKEIKYYDGSENVWKIGRVIVDE